MWAQRAWLCSRNYRGADMSNVFIAVLTLTDIVMCIGFSVMRKIIEELEDRVKACESYNKLDEKEIMELKGRCRDLEEKIKENTNEEHS